MSAVRCPAILKLPHFLTGQCENTFYMSAADRNPQATTKIETFSQTNNTRGASQTNTTQSPRTNKGNCWIFMALIDFLASAHFFSLFFIFPDSSSSFLLFLYRSNSYQG